MVTIIAEGGIDTLTNIYYDLRANIPVILIEVRKSNLLYVPINTFIESNRAAVVLLIF